MKFRTKLLITATLLLGIAFTVYQFRHLQLQPLQIPLPDFAAHACLLTPQTSLRYHIEATTRARYSPEALILGADKAPAPYKEESQDISGVLHLFVKGLDGRQAILEGVFENKEGESVPHLAMRLTSDCRLTGFHYSEGVSRELRMSLSNLLKEVQIVLPRDKRLSQWESVEYDGFGQYIAVYQVMEGPPSTVIIKKSKQAYKSLAQAEQGPKLQAKILTSSAEATIKEGHPWLDRFTSDQEIVLTAGESVFVEAVSHIRLERLDSAQNQVLSGAEGSGESMIAYEQSLLGERVDTSDEPYKPSYPMEAVKGQRIGSILREFSSLLDGGTPASRKKGLDMLVQFLRVRPKAAQGLIEAIAKGILPERHQSRAFLAMQLANTVAAQTALVEVLESDTFTAMNRMRSAIALQDVFEPTDEAIEALDEMMREIPATVEDSDEADVARTAALALGAMAGNLQERDGERAERIEQEISQQLRMATDDTDVAVLLDALGNTGNPRFLSDAESYLDNDTASVRISAALALGKIGTEKAESLLMGQLNDEESPRVRKNMIKALGEIKNLSDNSLDVIGRDLLTEPDAQVRAQMIRLLGPHAGEDEETARVLDAAFRHETDDNNVRLLGKYLIVDH